jgi:hypothetical protein
MANLIFEIWESVSDGIILHACCITGPRGDGQRQLLEPASRLLATYEADSHYNAMLYYHNYLGREIYTTREPLDYEPYPDEWAIEQQSFLNTSNNK